MIPVFMTLIIMHVLEPKHPLRRAAETKIIYRRFNSHDKKNNIALSASLLIIIPNNNVLFTQAPPRIKSFISACYAMTQSVGNLVVVIVSALSFRKQVRLLYSGTVDDDDFFV